MLERFFYVWIGYWGVYLIQPVHSLYGEVMGAFLLQFAFVGSVFLGFKLISSPTIKLNAESWREVNIEQFAVRIIVIGYSLSMVGMAMLLYDKLVIQGIDYSEGIASAREQWKVLGEEREGGVSSIYSSWGYVLGSAYFLPLAILFSRNIQFEDSKRIMLITVGLVILMGNSLLTGGRSGILLLIAFISYSYYTADRGLRLFERDEYRTTLKITLAVIAGYVLYVFYMRAVGSELTLSEYSIEFLEYLGMVPSDWLVEYADSSILGGLVSVLNLAAAYLTHSIVTVSEMLEFDGEKEVVVLGYLIDILKKLGIDIGVKAEWFLEGRFPSLPGAIFHQMGLLSMLVFGVVLGSLAGFVARMHVIFGGSFNVFLVCCSIESVLLLSPFLFAGDFLFFPFMLIGGFLSILIAKLTLD